MEIGIVTGETEAEVRGTKLRGFNKAGVIGVSLGGAIGVVAIDISVTVIVHPVTAVFDFRRAGLEGAASKQRIDGRAIYGGSVHDGLARATTALQRRTLH